MCKFNTKITIAQLLRLTIHSLRQGYLSPGNSIVLEIEAALLFISVTNSCRFWVSFVETQARLFSRLMHALRAYCHRVLTLLRPGQTLATFQRNILKHCCMMLRHVLNGVAKRTQHFHHFQRKMSMLMCPGPWHAFHSATMLRERGRTGITGMQHPKCFTKNLTVFKFDPTSSNMLQHIATGWPNVCNMLCPTMLQDVALKCC